MVVKERADGTVIQQRGDAQAGTTPVRPKIQEDELVICLRTKDGGSNVRSGVRVLIVGTAAPREPSRGYSVPVSPARRAENQAEERTRAGAHRGVPAYASGDPSIRRRHRPNGEYHGALEGAQNAAATGTAVSPPPHLQLRNVVAAIRLLLGSAPHEDLFRGDSDHTTDVPSTTG